MAKQLIRDYVFTPGIAGSGTVKFAGRYTLDKILLITNVTDNVIIYNFADTAFAGTTSTFIAADDATDFPKVTQALDGYTTITLQYNSSAMSSGDDLQIFVERSDEYGQTIRPWPFGTDAIERMRVSNPESLIDADFEYGLQPTKWANYGTVKGYPSAYDVPGVDLELENITTDFTTSSSTNSLITVAFDSQSPHGLSIGDVVNMSALDAGTAGFSRADGNFIIDNVPTTTSLKYYARGVVGTSNGQSLFTQESLARAGKLYANASIPVASVASDGSDPSVITLTMTNPHGLVPGTPIHVVMGSGTNKDNATGPFVITNTPSDRKVKFTARAGAVVGSPGSPTLYAFSNATILHRPSDGGVFLSTKTPTYAASVVRQSKRFFRYQSGKGLLFSSGTLFAPVYDVQSVSADGTAVGSTITIKTDDVDHGLQVGAAVRLEGVKTSGYDGTYTVSDIVDDYEFEVLATTTLGDTNAVLELKTKLFVTTWTGAAVRGGVFDDQNGVFFEYDGRQMYVVRRSAVDNIAGTITATQNSSIITGNNTRLSEQMRAGDRIVIRGMTHFVTAVTSNTEAFITPDYRGITASGIRAQRVEEEKVPQMKWNLDKMDGTGPSGYNFDTNKMQMIGIEWSWYGAGFIHFMLRGPDGKWVYCHRIKNNNKNNEAYMRSSNLPVRYSIDNDSPVTYLTNTIDSDDTVIPVANLQEFNDTGTIFIDNEIITYTGRSATDGPGNFTGCTRAATLTQYLQGTNNSLSAGGATGHSSNTGLIEISNTCSPTLSHWGSSLIMDGGFERDRGYLFTYRQSNVDITTTPKTAFCVRLAPSVANSLTGRLGARDLLNRSQMLVEEIAVSVGRSGGFFSSVGEIVVEGILNPRNFSDANWFSLNATARGGQPSFAQVSPSNQITWDQGSYAQPGELIFSYVAGSSNSGSSVTNLDLSKLKEMSGAPLGGDFMYPDGPDILAINIYMIFGSSKGSIALRWIEAQA